MLYFYKGHIKDKVKEQHGQHSKSLSTTNENIHKDMTCTLEKVHSLQVQSSTVHLDIDGSSKSTQVCLYIRRYVCIYTGMSIYTQVCLYILVNSIYQRGIGVLIVLGLAFVEDNNSTE